jgi:hypothetical protein
MGASHDLPWFTSGISLLPTYRGRCPSSIEHFGPWRMKAHGHPHRTACWGRKPIRLAVQSRVIRGEGLRIAMRAKADRPPTASLMIVREGHDARSSSWLR